MTTIKTITLAKASKQLAVPEEQLRQSIKPLYPETWETIKSIKLAEFETLAEALRDLAESEADETETSILADESNSEHNETALTVAESSDLPSQQTEQAAQLKIATIQTFSDFALDLNQITQALAYSTALKNFANFKEIHSTTFRHYAEQYIQDFGQEYQQMVSDLEEKCDPKAFLQQRGIITASTNG